MDAADQEVEWRPNKLSVASWAMYDLANTIFALGVGSRYFSVWVVDERGGEDSFIAYATTAGMVLVILAAPWIGSRSDHYGRRRPYLIVTTLITVTATAGLATVGLAPSLALYAVGLVGFHLGSVIYDALLPDVSTPENRGRVSGIGVAVGYLGSFVGLGAGFLLLERHGYPAVFRAIAVLFLLFALPAFFFIRERPRSRAPGRPAPIRQAFAHLLASWRRARTYPGMTRFLVGRFLYSDAINTVLIFVAVYAVEELGFSDGETDALAAAAIAGALAGALIAGRFVDRLGPRAVLHVVLYLWMAALLVGVAAAATDVKSAGWVVGVAGGLALGGTWTSDRVYMTRLSPPRLLGEFYGLYATVGRFATILGPLLWGVIVDRLRLGRTVALGSLVVYLIVARVVLEPVTDRLPTRETTFAD